MSEEFINRLAGQVVRHPAFTAAIERTVADVLAVVLREQFAGEEVRMYVPKMGPSKRNERAEAIVKEGASGLPVAELAKRHGLTPRRVNQILAAGRGKS